MCLSYCSSDLCSSDLDLVRGGAGNDTLLDGGLPAPVPIFNAPALGGGTDDFGGGGGNDRVEYGADRVRVTLDGKIGRGSCRDRLSIVEVVSRCTINCV